MPGFSWRVKQYASARMAVGIKILEENVSAPSKMAK